MVACVVTAIYSFFAVFCISVLPKPFKADGHPLGSRSPRGLFLVKRFCRPASPHDCFSLLSWFWLIDWCVYLEISAWQVKNLRITVYICVSPHIVWPLLSTHWAFFPQETPLDSVSVYRKPGMSGFSIFVSDVIFCLLSLYRHLY